MTEAQNSLKKYLYHDFYSYNEILKKSTLSETFPNSKFKRKKKASKITIL